MVSLRCALALTALAGAALAAAGPASACGAGVTKASRSMAIDGQRVFVSVRDNGTTDVVVQLNVASAEDDYGVLLPVPVEPTLDPQPIDTQELDDLDKYTRPQLTKDLPRSHHSSSSGCGCGSDSAGAEGGDLGGGGRNNGVSASEFVQIGPVTAVSLARLTTIVDPTTLDQDTTFTEPIGQVPNSKHFSKLWFPPVGTTVRPEERRYGVGFALLALPVGIAFGRRLKRRSTHGRTG